MCKRNTGVFSTKVLANCAMESRTTQQKACQVPSQAAYQGICQSVGHFDARDRRASVSHFTPATSSRSSNTGCRSVFSHSEFRISQVADSMFKGQHFPLFDSQRKAPIFHSAGRRMQRRRAILEHTAHPLTRKELCTGITGRSKRRHATHARIPLASPPCASSTRRGQQKG